MIGDDTGLLHRGARLGEDHLDERAQAVLTDAKIGRDSDVAAWDFRQGSHGRSRIFTPPSPARMPASVGMKRSPFPVTIASWYVWLTACAKGWRAGRLRKPAIEAHILACDADRSLEPAVVALQHPGHDHLEHGAVGAARGDHLINLVQIEAEPGRGSHRFSDHCAGPNRDAVVDE